MPSEQRVLLDVAHAGEQLAVMRILRHLKLDEATAQSLYFGLVDKEVPQSIAEVERFLESVRRF